LGQSVREVAPGHVVLGDGTEIPTRCTIWAGGEKAASLARASGLGLGRGGRVDVLPDLSVEGHPRLFVLGDLANIADQDGTDLPQLGSVALQSGQWTAASIRADLAGRPRTPFRYHDKGIMAMISRGSAVAEVGARRHELHGPIAFASWLGVHAWLMSGVRTRIDAFVSWGWDYFSQNRAPGLLDQPDAARIDWRDEDISDADTPDPSVPEQQGARGAAGSSAPVIPGG
ncbi:MAG: NAD(P)/FAD-dependent oxidoreductase, partial [Acidimicrobiia bacterium]